MVDDVGEEWVDCGCIILYISIFLLLFMEAAKAGVQCRDLQYYYDRERRGVEGQERVEEERRGPNQEQSVSNGWSGKGE